MHPMKVEKSRIVALTDASYNRRKTCPSVFAGMFFVSGYDVDCDQNLYTNEPTDRLAPVSSKPAWVRASLVFWRTRVVIRRVGAILDVATLSIQCGSVAAEYLQNLGLGMQVVCSKLKPCIFNDNDSTITHVKSSNKHKNPRMSVIWGALRQAFTSNKLALKFLCGKSLNIVDVGTKLKSNALPLFIKSLRLGKLFRTP
ncbi:unnamed protein product [Amoebophrya sp. A25]|nr:unnamed protein product [Amoebophrya sp. A25]|eukprot:GSA25T00023402001.1